MRKSIKKFSHSPSPLFSVGITASVMLILLRRFYRLLMDPEITLIECHLIHHRMQQNKMTLRARQSFIQSGNPVEMANIPQKRALL